MAFPQSSSLQIKAKTAALLTGDKLTRGLSASRSDSTVGRLSFRDNINNRTTSEILASLRSTFCK